MQTPLPLPLQIVCPEVGHASKSGLFWKAKLHHWEERNNSILPNIKKQNILFIYPKMTPSILQTTKTTPDKEQRFCSSTRPFSNI